MTSIQKAFDSIHHQIHDGLALSCTRWAVYHHALTGYDPGDCALLARVGLDNGELICHARRPCGLVDYRKEDPSVRIKEVHKMSVKQLEREMSAVGLVRVRTVETLPLQHIVISKSAIRFSISTGEKFGTSLGNHAEEEIVESVQDQRVIFSGLR